MAGKSTILKIDILGDSRSAEGAARRTEGAYGRMGRSVDSAGSSADRNRGKFSRLGGAIGGAVKRFGPLAAAAGGAALVKFGSDSIKAASDVQQAFGGVESVFGKNAATVKRWAGQAASNVGLAKAEYADMATVLGSSLKNSGIDDYAGKTNKLIGLGGDLAATFGGKTSEAVEALGSLLRGESDPIERYGVSIKQSDVNARLAANGQDKLTGSALRQAEQTARLQLLYQQTTAAQGAFSRESNTLAGQQQRLSARFTNLKATLGAKLLPVATKVVRWLADTVGGSNRTSKVLQTLASIIGRVVRPVVSAIGSAFRTVSGAIDKATGSSRGSGDGLRKLGAAAKPVASFIGRTLAGAFRTVATVIGAAIRVIGGIVRAIGAIGSIASSVARAVGALISKLKSISAGTVGKIAGLFRSGDPLMGPGLARAGGGSGLISAASTSQILDLTLRSQPNVNITFDSAVLRGVVKAEVNEQLTRTAVQIRRR